jgi:hypothetical protein
MPNRSQTAAAAAAAVGTAELVVGGATRRVL